MTTEHTSDDKLLAALGYWGSLVLGFIPALVIFFLKKDESPFIKKHALQALVLNFACIAFTIASMILMQIVAMVTFGIGPLLLIPILMLLGVGVAIYFVFLGIQVFQGQDPNIPYLTPMIEKHLSS